MRVSSGFRFLGFAIFTCALVGTSIAFTSHIRRDNRLGTQSAEYYQKGFRLLETNYESKSWKALINRGYVPYHRLTESDFTVNDQVDSPSIVYTKGFIKYECDGKYEYVNRDTVRAVLTYYKVYSGLDRSQSWRRSMMTNPSAYLEHEQGHLDIGEISARTLAAEIAQTKPEGLGHTKEEAKQALETKLAAIFKQVMTQGELAQDNYDRVTRAGMDMSAQATATKSIQERLTRVDARATWIAPTQSTTSQGLVQ